MTELAALVPLLLVALFIYGMFRLIKGRSEGKTDGTTKCRDCKADIPSNATKCMPCGAKQPKQVGILGYIFVGLLLILFAPIIFNSGSDKPSKPISPDRAKQLSHERQALEACLPALRSAAKFPSSVDFHTFSSSYQHLTNGGVRFSIDLDAKNALGSELPMRGICEWKNGAVTLATMINR